MSTQRQVTTQLTMTEFFANVPQFSDIILGANCGVVVKTKYKDLPVDCDSYEFELTQSKEKQDKNNKLKDGTKFGVSARSRFSRNLAQYAMNFNGNFGFLTLTFPPCDYDGRYEPMLLDNILTRACQRYFKKLVALGYICAFAWVAERHTANDVKHEKTQGLHKGFLHFHCFCFFNGFCDVKELNTIWLKILNGKGCKIVGFKTKNINAEEYNPVDVDFFKGKAEISKMLVYVKKYCTKDNENGKIFSRRWGWSRSLSGLNGKVEISQSDLSQIMLECSTYDALKYMRFYRIDIIENNGGKLINTETGEIPQTIIKTIYTALLPYQAANLPIFQNYFKI